MTPFDDAFRARVIEASRGKLLRPVAERDDRSGRLILPCPVLVTPRYGATRYLKTVDGLGRPTFSWGYNFNGASVLAKAVLKEVGLTAEEAVPFMPALADTFRRIAPDDVEWELPLTGLGVQIGGAVQLALQALEGKDAHGPEIEHAVQRAMEVPGSLFAARPGQGPPTADGLDW